jgi:protein phosphatase/serine/threonine-protein phosphatase Stp1
MSARMLSRALTHCGTVRTRNEDTFVDRADIGLWAVADGAGGHGSGDVASAAVAATLADLPCGLSAAELLAQVRLRIGAVHAELQRVAAQAEDKHIIATTAVVLLARGEHCACLWAGDSRAYLLRDGSLSRLTHDHSVVQELVDAGLLAREAAEDHPQANVITRAIGADGPLELDKVSARIGQGDVLLLCSDGLFKALPESEIESRLSSGEEPQQLIDAALAAGARDNVTAIVVHAEA